MDRRLGGGDAAEHPGAVEDGGAGVVVGQPGKPLAVVSFTVTGGRIAAIDLITDRAKLGRLMD